VPKKYKEDLKLSKWVDNQRTRFKHGKMDPERNEKLDEIGFVFTAREKDWNFQFQKLLDYYVKHGHGELFWVVDRCTFMLNVPTYTTPVSLAALQVKCHTGTRKTRHWVLGSARNVHSSKLANWIRNGNG
jgi:hypothetical protein